MILEVRNLKKSFKRPFSREKICAVDDVSFSLKKGSTLGIVGESGSGKSTIAKLVMRLLPCDAGDIYFEGKEISRLKENGLTVFRKKTQMIFQDPFLSLDPKMKVRDILAEPTLVGGHANGISLDAKIKELLACVELDPRFLFRYPRELSGGECQRIAIARAISMNPDFLVCDEPVSSLDLLVQAQVLNLLLKLQKDRSISFLFISHDLRVVRHMSDEVLVLKKGQVCEMGPRDQIFQNPKEPYTKELVQNSLQMGSPRFII